MEPKLRIIRKKKSEAESAHLDPLMRALKALHSAGVISGMPDGSFQPYATATREQACTMLCML